MNYMVLFAISQGLNVAITSIVATRATNLTILQKMSVLEKSQFCAKKNISNFFREILKNMSKMRFYFIDAPPK